VIAWTLRFEPRNYVFLVNTDPEHEAVRFALPHLNEAGQREKFSLICEFSTLPRVPETDQGLTFNGKHYKITRLAPGEARVYRVKLIAENMS
jgi:hypothetical protein